MPEKKKIDGKALRGLLCCLLAPAAFILDRLAKGWAQRRLAGQGPVTLWEGVLGLRYHENTGAAFSMLQGRPVLLAVITGLFLLGLLVYLLTKGRRLPPLPYAALWLLLGGAAGNLYDRIAYGYVVDMIEITLFRFPVFNVADMCVCIAFVPLAAWLLFGKE